MADNTSLPTAALETRPEGITAAAPSANEPSPANQPTQPPAPPPNMDDRLRGGLLDWLFGPETTRARFEAAGAALILVLLLLILLLIAAALERTDILPLAQAADLAVARGPALRPQLSDTTINVAGPAAAEQSNNSAAPPITLNAEVAPQFRSFYDGCGGERIFGRPISGLTTHNGRTMQWFERGRIEAWPEFAGTRYEVQSGAVGREYTRSTTFPRVIQPERPDTSFFRETGYTLAEPFLSFWRNNGAMVVFGYPISDQMQETLSNGQIHTVQYFERARMEHHPQLRGTPYEIQLGLLGLAVYNGVQRQPNIAPVIVPTIEPTSVPTPQPLPTALPTAVPTAAPYPYP